MPVSIKPLVVLPPRVDAQSTESPPLNLSSSMVLHPERMVLVPYLQTPNPWPMNSEITTPPPVVAHSEINEIFPLVTGVLFVLAAFVWFFHKLYRCRTRIARCIRTLFEPELQPLVANEAGVLLNIEGRQQEQVQGQISTLIRSNSEWPVESSFAKP